MSITIAEFDRTKHLDAAASLLAARHVRDRERDRRFPAAYEVPAAVQPFIEQALDGALAYGAVALDGREIAGFAVMNVQLIAPTHFLASFFPPRGATLGYAAHAVAQGREYDVYRELYGALADHYVTLGYFDHSIAVPARDTAAQDALHSLGFGRSMCAAIRHSGPTERAAANVDVHQASDEDAEVIFRLSEELTLHHARSPIFNPYMRESDASSHDMQRNLLSDPANAHWVGYEDGKAVGMNTFMPPNFLSPMTVPEKTIYLFQGIVTQDARASGVGTAILSKGAEWAREQGYEHIALHFATANLSGAKFWQSSGFQPVEYGMRRRVDDRIAWANK
jgi:GNAT superfamily N-acetyltransferase